MSILFIHLGGDMMVSTKDVIAILDTKMVNVCDDTRRFLQAADGKGLVFRVESGQEKSIVITETRVFISPISSLTLKKRAGYITEVDG
ncbi:extracellular matrix regulator RemB [Kyrpidia sp.]|uniref:extracellular matrix regulator RemB n=1 Tax=Kyrpidia sp. TaxID=2073077 RepID=UPI00258E8C6A|nr:extracellular matrix/biofilm biosynthesis regulator RemA family protein [Kyrpidia sp.]